MKWDVTCSSTAACKDRHSFILISTGSNNSAKLKADLTTCDQILLPHLCFNFQKVTKAIDLQQAQRFSIPSGTTIVTIVDSLQQIPAHLLP